MCVHRAPLSSRAARASAGRESPPDESRAAAAMTLRELAQDFPHEICILHCTMIGVFSVPTCVLASHNAFLLRPLAAAAHGRLAAWCCLRVLCCCVRPLLWWRALRIYRHARLRPTPEVSSPSREKNPRPKRALAGMKLTRRPPRPLRAPAARSRPARARAGSTSATSRSSTTTRSCA